MLFIRVLLFYAYKRVPGTAIKIEGETSAQTQRCARRDQGQRDGARAVFARERRTKDAVVVIAMVAANAGGVGLRFRLDARASGSTRERKQHREVDGSHTHNALDEW